MTADQTTPLTEEEKELIQCYVLKAMWAVNMGTRKWKIYIRPFLEELEYSLGQESPKEVKNTVAQNCIRRIYDIGGIIPIRG